MHPKSSWVKLLYLSLICVYLTMGNPVSAKTELNLTPNELSQYNGQNGKPAYVAVKGVVYDVTNVPEWANGMHYCRQAIAGKDLTFIWNMAPRSHQDPAFLKQFPVVGHLVAAKPETAQPSKTQKPEPSSKEKIFTLKTLAQYNGKNGRPAYVAVKGVVYDVTKVPAWANGMHYCRQAIAGKDLTFIWNMAPRSHQNPRFLKRFPVVGRMAVENTQPQPKTPEGPPMWMSLAAGLFIALMIAGAWMFFQLFRRQ